ncbi:hypothetical protein QLQ15_02585 [Lysobacter sp. LF1]|uniref:Secreted protein n=1 Tax=Lysobacter stagni TaxID=3045172 RepID=A0ABT6XCF8_9GAMM|nr:hypothetical protein [Lysobacter sp. LF1]MDI9237797.1 hypothetical protein [Lysobacter sp. LF1]
MKQFVVTVLLAGLLAPAAGMAQEGYRCVVVCNPSRVYCVPNGSQLPPIISICKPYQVGASTETSLLTTPSEAAATAPQSACSAQSVFNEETQTNEWQMVCD